MASDGWKSVSRQEPCPICQKPKNCTVSVDGGAVWCGQVSEGSKSQNYGGQFLHFLREQDDWKDRDWTLPVSLKRMPSEARRDFSSRAEEGFSHPDAPQKRVELAEELGVELRSLERLGIGWDSSKRNQGCWTAPERDAAGKVIRVSTRLRSGGKKFVFGSKRGLIYADDWQDGDGPILLVEGGSDTAALLSMELSVVGRPSDLGGVNLLAEMLREIPDKREIIVVGENDWRDHESLTPSIQERHNPECEFCKSCWPGKNGAIKTAEKLSQLLCRDVGWCLAPDDAKDARDWLRAMRERRAAE